MFFTNQFQDKCCTTYSFPLGYAIFPDSFTDVLNLKPTYPIEILNESIKGQTKYVMAKMLINFQYSEIQYT